MACAGPILPRSLHLPRASTDGSRTQNLNKNGVRLWTACSRHRRLSIEYDYRVFPTIGLDGMVGLFFPEIWQNPEQAEGIATLAESPQMQTALGSTVGRAPGVGRQDVGAARRSLSSRLNAHV